MSDPKPNLEGPSPTGSPIQNKARLEAVNSQIGNAAQINASPGTTVHQTHITLVQTSPGLSRTDLLFWSLMALAVLVVASRATINIGLPPVISQLAAGSVLATIVWKVFERIEAVLTDQTKLEISLWLVTKEPISEKANRLQGQVLLFATHLFGADAELTKTDWRSLALALAAYAIVGAIVLSHYGFRTLVKTFDTPYHPHLSQFLMIALGMAQCSSLLLRNVIATERRVTAARVIWHFVGAVVIVYFLSVLMVTGTYAVAAIDDDPIITGRPPTSAPNLKNILLISTVMAVGTLIPSIWIAGFVIAASCVALFRRVDLGFDWFNRKLDIENKPLSAIGIVAGALVALAYWGVAFGWWIVNSFTHHA